MKVIEVHEYKFPSYLLPVLINNDPIDETDRGCFEAFIDRLEQYKMKYRAVDYTIDYELDSYFSKSNCLNNLGCNVTDIKVHFINN